MGRAHRTPSNHSEGVLYHYIVCIIIIIIFQASGYLMTKATFYTKSGGIKLLRSF